MVEIKLENLVEDKCSLRNPEVQPTIELEILVENNCTL
jgi:hypothetical protein